MKYKTKKERQAYWDGYCKGQLSSTKHNFHLLKNQINPSCKDKDYERIKKEEKEIEKIKKKLFKSIEGISKLL